MRIFVVEDDELVREFVQVCLADEGHEVTATGDADAALQALGGGGKADLLLSDFKLGGKLDGVDVATEFLRRFPASHVLLISGDPADARAKLRTLGRGTFLPKPFFKADLVAAVDRAMMNR